MVIGKQLPVYLVHWNAPEWVSSAAISILASDIPVAVTVVDNGPASATAAMDLPSEVRIISTGGNRGYAGGANVALRDWLPTGADWCVIGAHDLHVESSDLRRMLTAAWVAPSFGILGPDTREHGGRSYYAGKHLGYSEGIEERSVMSGTCLLLRRSCILQIGLLDEQFGSYGEDDELCHRARRYGWKVGRVSGTRAHGLGTKASNRRELVVRNRVLLQIKLTGKRSAGIPVLGHYLKELTVLAMRGAMSAGFREEHRGRTKSTLSGLRRGFPMLWAELEPPPPAPLDTD